MDSEFGVSSKVTRELLPTIAGPFLSPRSVLGVVFVGRVCKGEKPNQPFLPGVNQRGKFEAMKILGDFFLSICDLTLDCNIFTSVALFFF